MSDDHGLAGVVTGDGEWTSGSSLWTGGSFERAGRRLGAELLSGGLNAEPQGGGLHMEPQRGGHQR
jgi:hypothetical protein